MSSRVRRALYR